MYHIFSLFCNDPFVPSIMEEIFSSNWKNLTMEKYDGTTDLDDHVDVYITQVSLHTTDDAILY